MKNAILITQDLRIRQQADRAGFEVQRRCVAKSGTVKWRTSREHRGLGWYGTLPDAFRAVENAGYELPPDAVEVRDRIHATEALIAAGTAGLPRRS